MFNQITKSMKKILLSLLAIALAFNVSAQKQRVKAPQSMLNMAIEKQAAIDETTNLQNTVNPYVNRLPWDQNEVEIGGTVYDLQSNAASPSNRLEVFNDGTVGATWNRGTGPTAYTDRGTGYNYFNGAAWGPAPTNRVETLRSGWPAYTACGPTGEAFVSHQSGTAPMTFAKREVKGTGSWTESQFAAPAGASAGLLWPRMTSSGENNEFLHVIALTAPVANGGTVFNGQDGALVYSRSTDAGATFSAPVVLEGMGATDYVAFGGDGYSITAVGNNVAILCIDNWTDLFAMVSRDNGETWEKIVIWEHPIPLWNNTATTDTIYCPDGSGHATFGHDGKLHVTFGVNRAMHDGSAASWFPFVDGLAYWNEDMEPWTGGDQVNVLNPDLLWESGHLIGYMIDINNNGELDWIGTAIENIGLYYVSPTSMPQIIVDQYNDIWVVYTSITEGYDNGAQQYRHLWVTSSLDGGATWEDQIHLSTDIIHMLDECVFPTIAREQGNYREDVHVIYQADAEPGLAVRGDEDAPGENIIYYLTIEKQTVGTKNLPVINEVQVTAYPNPSNGVTSLDVTLAKKANVSVEIYSVTGQKVMEQSYGQFSAGKFQLKLNASDLNSGLYFVKVLAGDQSSTTKINVL
jgi:hypothetical protein